MTAYVPGPNAEEVLPGSEKLRWALPNRTVRAEDGFEGSYVWGSGLSSSFVSSGRWPFRHEAERGRNVEGGTYETPGVSSWWSGRRLLLPKLKPRAGAGAALPREVLEVVSVDVSSLRASAGADVGRLRVRSHGTVPMDTAPFPERVDRGQYSGPGDAEVTKRVVLRDSTPPGTCRSGRSVS